MAEHVLVTGGAGFIGSHLVDALVDAGYDVRVLDNFAQQVHNGEIPEYLNSGAEYIVGDVRDREAVVEAVEGVDMVAHLASAVGVGQSMYEIGHYTDVNVTGTATLLDVLVNEDNHDVENLVVASSMSNYGEGVYECSDCGEVYPENRDEDRLDSGEWEHVCPHCGSDVDPAPTPEDKPLRPTSIYAQTKRDQEEMSLLIGETYDIDVVALRYFSVYGPRRSLDNPYTGVMGIFSSRIKNGNPPQVYEDGNQSRDFVFVRDVVRATVRALENDIAGEIINVGTGEPTTVREVAETLIDAYGADMAPEITGEYRAGDVRHCFADTEKMEQLLGVTPEYSFEEGMEEFVAWADQKEMSDDFAQAEAELDEEGLIR